MAQDTASSVEKGHALPDGEQHLADQRIALPIHRKLSSYVMEEIEPDQTLMQFAGYCLLTGLTSAPVFSACYIWPGFQTGGFVQLSLAVARLFSAHPRDFRFEIADRQALTSLLCFLLGTSLGRLGDKIGPKRRVWVTGATLFQALLVMAAALCIHYSGEPSLATSRGQPSWYSALGLAGIGFASASLGLHGIVSKRINSQFGTAIVLTTVWVELICDPKLFVMKAVKTRDHRLIACVGLFLGGLFGAALTHTIGAPGTFGVAAGVRVLSAVSWFIVPSKKA
ncbi:hypothetical protein BCR35DRAFT_355931 [Leucosporidium creatinivorum]|uniref:DUF1275 domain protein n=1 Tax=Leucosporidium creatinivorum TaxID=106004 RepID=A0A1Y2D4J9_9BASI|nr:hypothetical protein BCR35DRAFT_355931 [Leucosporidium creatinivorum]